MKRAFHSWPMTIFSIVAVLFLGYRYWLPVSYWLDVRQVLIPNTFDTKQPILLNVDRTIRREFTAEWTVEVHSLVGTFWVDVCNASGRSIYGPDSKLPDPLTLEWWTADKCVLREPGIYRVVTSWSIHGWLGADRTLTIASNSFSIGALQ